MKKINGLKYICKKIPIGIGATQSSEEKTGGYNSLTT